MAIHRIGGLEYHFASQAASVKDGYATCEVLDGCCLRCFQSGILRGVNWPLLPVCLQHGRLFAHKPAAAMVNCYRAGATAALDQLNKYFTFSEMPVVSSNYWNMIVDPHPDRVKRDQYGQDILRTLAANMAYLLHQTGGRRK